MWDVATGCGRRDAVRRSHGLKNNVTIMCQIQDRNVWNIDRPSMYINKGICRRVSLYSNFCLILVYYIDRKCSHCKIHFLLTENARERRLLIKWNEVSLLCFELFVITIFHCHSSEHYRLTVMIAEMLLFLRNWYLKACIKVILSNSVCVKLCSISSITSRPKRLKYIFMFVICLEILMTFSKEVCDN